MKRKTQKRGTEIKMGTKIRKQEHGKKLRASCGKTETGLQGKAWLLDDLRKVRHLRRRMMKKQTRKIILLRHYIQVNIKLAMNLHIYQEIIQ
jgi:hypothetical protein